MKDRTSRLPDSACTACGKVMDAASCVSGDYKPDPEDITICIYCGHIMGFTNEMKLRELSLEEWQEIKQDPKIQHLQKT